ncbi:hypothetical protein F8M41_013722 [Gigaspora margarita]|uniref:Uncharacterized protein n=1 Tax=Gigaspora margarita TaxID=4874 RepID=A0A8H3WY98_GIGMA|nr:hypothetical protein F8M41_013722 [Gigaspora margarita]
MEPKEIKIKKIVTKIDHTNTMMELDKKEIKIEVEIEQESEMQGDRSRFDDVSTAKKKVNLKKEECQRRIGCPELMVISIALESELNDLRTKKIKSGKGKAKKDDKDVRAEKKKENKFKFDENSDEPRGRIEEGRTDNFLNSEVVMTKVGDECVDHANKLKDPENY